MAPKRILVLALVSLAGLAAVPSAGAAGLSGQRVVSTPAATATATVSTLIAPSTVCPGQTDLAAPASAQEKSMRCMTDFARANAGLAGLAESPVLAQSAAAKVEDVIRCDSFSHFACGREFTYWIEQGGYTSVPCWQVGENLAWGTGEYGTVRSIFRAWMASPEHRENILGSYEEVGIDLRVGSLAGQDGAHVWAQHFGNQC